MMFVQAGTSISPILEGPGFQALAHASDTEEYVSFGPPRLGTIQLDVVTDSFRQSNPDAAEVVITDGVHQYIYNPNGMVSTPGMCSFPSTCEYKPTLPFDLGTTFVIFGFANAGLSSTTVGGGSANDSAVMITFTLPVEFAVVPVPEASTSATFLIGVAAGTAPLLLKVRRDPAEN
jgi:hypothetical protein